MMHTDLQVSWFIIFKKAPSCVGVYLMFFWNVESLADWEQKGYHSFAELQDLNRAIVLPL